MKKRVERSVPLRRREKRLLCLRLDGRVVGVGSVVLVMGCVVGGAAA